MPTNNRLEFPDFQALGKDLQDFLKTLPDLAGIAAVNFFQDRFTQKGWVGNSGFEPWQKRKNSTSGSLLLKTGALKDSYDYQTGKDWLEVTNFAPYSSLHNQGGILTIRITKKSRKFFWYMFKRTGVSKWKFMALTKANTMQINIPKRQHIGHSGFLMKKLDKAYTQQLDKLTQKTF